ncbi:sensor domain-containing protein [Ornithinibacillus halophilus]|nr:sensor domain-containing diguanylate cyclase [Ornithinibacillus halophilus]
MNDVLLNNVLLNGIKDMIYVMEVRNGQYIYSFINQAVREFAGFSDDILGKTIQEVVSEEKWLFLLEKYDTVLLQKDSLVFEDYYPSPMGETRYAENTLTPIFNEDQECTHIVAVTKDITKRKIAERKAEKSKEMLIEGKQRYQSLFDYNLDAVLTLDENGYAITGNRSLEVMTGYTSQEVAGKRYNALVVEEDKDKCQKYFRLALDGILEEFRIRIRNKDNQIVELIVKLTPIVVNNEIVGIYVICKDITALINMRNRFNESENMFQIITEHSRDLITVLNHDGEIIYVSPSYKDILGYDEISYVGEKFYYNLHPDDIGQVKKTFELSKNSKEAWVEQFRQRHKTDGWIWSELHGSPIYDNRNQFKYMVVVSRDISLRKDYETELEYFANHDVLTGLPNRRYFIDRFEQELLSTKGKTNLALIILDLDDFKPVNDSYGHEMGDHVIIEFGKRIKEVVRKSDVVARLGGDEFVVLLPDISSKDQVVDIASRIVSNVEKPWNIQGTEIHLTASVGVAYSSQKLESVHSFLRTADGALYEVKNNGGNNYKLISI